MNLHNTTVQFLVYLKALGLSTKRLNSYRKVMADIEAFYGPETALDEFDNSLILDYVLENDPFDTDPIKVERGAVFCKFTHWMMKNRMIPAWAKEMQEIEEEEANFEPSPKDSQISDYRIF